MSHFGLKKCKNTANIGVKKGTINPPALGYLFDAFWGPKRGSAENEVKNRCGGAS